MSRPQPWTGEHAMARAKLNRKLYAYTDLDGNTHMRIHHRFYKRHPRK
jgi:hypothetical protein